MEFVHKVRVRYGETDAMGLVYHGAYALYFEEARTEMLRRKGITYRAVEESGILMPVRELNIRFLKGARYDEIINIQVGIHEKPVSRMRFDYKCFDQAGGLLNTAMVELMFVRKDTFRPVKCPLSLLQYFPEWS